MQTLILTFVKKSYLDVFEGLGLWEYLYFILVFFKFVNEIFSSLSFFNVDYCLATISSCVWIYFSFGFFFFYFFIAVLLFFPYFYFFVKYHSYYSFWRFFLSIYNIFTINLDIWAFTFTTRANSSGFALKFPMVLKQHGLFVRFTWKFYSQHLCK